MRATCYYPLTKNLWTHCTTDFLGSLANLAFLIFAVFLLTIPPNFKCFVFFDAFSKFASWPTENWVFLKCYQTQRSKLAKKPKYLSIFCFISKLYRNENFLVKTKWIITEKSRIASVSRIFFYPFSMIVISAFVGRRAPDVYGDCKTTCISKFTTSVKQM